MLDDVDIHPRTLVAYGYTGWATLFFLGSAILLAFAGLILALFPSRSRSDRAGPLLAISIAGAASLALGLGSALLVVLEARTRVVDYTLPSSTYWTSWSKAIESSESAYASMGIALAVVPIPFVLALGVHSFLSRRETPRGPLWAALLVFVTALGILRRTYAAKHPFTASYAVADVLWLRQQSFDIVMTTRVAVVVIAIVASVFVLLKAYRERQEAPSAPSASMKIASAVVAVFGLLAWLGARPIARDGASPLPFPEEAFVGYRCPELLSSDPEELPRISGSFDPCSDMFSPSPLALIDLGSKGPKANQKALKDPGDAFQYVNDKRLDCDNPPTNTPWPDLYLAAPAKMPASDVAPWLGAVENWRQRVKLVVVHDQPAFVSATAGSIPRATRCSCQEIKLKGSGAELPGASWGDIAKAAAAAPSDAPLVVSPGWSLRFENESGRVRVEKSP